MIAFFCTAVTADKLPVSSPFVTVIATDLVSARSAEEVEADAGMLLAAGLRTDFVICLGESVAGSDIFLEAGSRILLEVGLEIGSDIFLGESTTVSDIFLGVGLETDADIFLEGDLDID